VRVHNVHERSLTASPERVAALFEDMDSLWPAPVPRPDEGKLRLGSILRHTVDGEAVGDFEEIWRDRGEPMHDVYIEALFDRAEEALA
jgi:hypothetical protein